MLSQCTNGIKERIRMMAEWFEEGGALIIGYEMYRNLANHRFVKSKKMKEAITKYLVDPGIFFFVFVLFQPFLLVFFYCGLGNLYIKFAANLNLKKR